jgi:hypothetical protein
MHISTRVYAHKKPCRLEAAEFVPPPRSQPPNDKSISTAEDYEKTNERAKKEDMRAGVISKAPLGGMCKMDVVDEARKGK